MQKDIKDSQIEEKKIIELLKGYTEDGEFTKLSHKDFLNEVKDFLNEVKDLDSLFSNEIFGENKLNKMIAKYDNSFYYKLMVAVCDIGINIGLFYANTFVGIIATAISAVILPSLYVMHADLAFEQKDQIAGKINEIIEVKSIKLDIMENNNRR